MAFTVVHYYHWPLPILDTDYLQQILLARVYDVAIDTPLNYASNLSRRLKHDIWLKREDEQPIFSFKIRGAYNKMSRLPKSVLTKGVVAASAGNHAQGVALAGQTLNCPVTIFMPVTSPQIKVDSVKALGAKIKLIGDSYADAGIEAQAYCKRHKLRQIPPYDDPDIIAGNGTIGMEIMRSLSGRVDAIFVPVGGGGLIAGVAAYVKQVSPNVKIIGVEPYDSDAMNRSLAAGRRVKIKEVGIFADGVAVKQVGRESFRLVRQYVDEIVLVNTDETCAAIKDIFEDTRTIVEPSGALAVAGMKKYCEKLHKRKRTLVAINSGANMNFDRLRHVSERAEIGERREAILAVTIPERPGSFRQFCSTIGDHSITEFNYRYSDSAKAHVYAGIQISGQHQVNQIKSALTENGYSVLDLTDNEIAKIHIRHMVGGASHSVENEQIYRFEFPERPGALLEFLQKMGNSWNISLFHYRNHGADFGRVLCGVQVPPKQRGKFEKFLKEVGYAYVEETTNPAYKMFLT